MNMFVADNNWLLIIGSLYYNYVTKIGQAQEEILLDPKLSYSTQRKSPLNTN